MGVKIRERPIGSGIWWVFINHHSQRKAKKIGKDEKLAREVAKKIEAKLALGDLNLEKQPKIPTFGEYSQKWLAFIKMNRRESTYERYNQVLRDHILPVFKNKVLDSIIRGDVRDFLIAKAEKLCKKRGHILNCELTTSSLLWYLLFCANSSLTLRTMWLTAE